ncbi:DEAD/DEAH box helicase [Paracidovorax konjaci]|uniref:Superfamily II DNA and RNA helicase n=1 Tax=Paracidovorax konjaci TaxID=32040 RepID=A0A1I1YSK3_9BURK|nr:DEAD/DEAH box helicase [Paracidovorax konjaci]SFE22526.1 Superfamily II DNA and RNA helicase [Paracidovorax konjaci]
MPFAALGLSPALVQAADAQGFTAPTPVQAEAIPAVLQGRDLRGCAQTGSGKTVAFGLPLLQQLLPGGPGAGQGDTLRRVRALVLVPTRELAVQVAGVLGELARHLPARRLKIALAYGGVSINPQMMALRGGADVVVATPGRLLDLVEHNALSLAWVRTLVLDEADRLLDLGFAEELQRVLALLPAHRQNLLFSATFPDGVAALAEGLLRDPLRIDIPQEPGTAPDIAQRAIAVEDNRRTQLLRHLVKEEAGWTRVLVFVATQYAAEHVAEKLYKAGIYASPFHGGLSQGTRRQVLQEFKDERWQVLVTTDLAARGIDIAGLPAVVNYDLPRAAADYVHRIGRTGRAGASGAAVSFVTPGAAPHWQLIARRQGLLSLPVEQIAGFEVALATPPAGGDGQALGAAPDAAPRAGKLPPGTGGVKGKRPSKKDKLRAAAAAAAQAGGAEAPQKDHGPE